MPLPGAKFAPVGDIDANTGAAAACQRLSEPLEAAARCWRRANGAARSGKQKSEPAAATARRDLCAGTGLIADTGAQ